MSRSRLQVDFDTAHQGAFAGRLLLESFTVIVHKMKKCNSVAPVISGRMRNLTPQKAIEPLAFDARVPFAREIENSDVWLLLICEGSSPQFQQCQPQCSGTGRSGPGSGEQKSFSAANPRENGSAINDPSNHARQYWRNGPCMKGVIRAGRFLMYFA